ncbi:host cell division inhibitor Icd-like protein [Gilliamella sp. G0441]|uniref:host cell division inhibitor Icd-like protein n=1 Tax=Gilliamella sp. G0441 TaxID=3384760 RepID=UPI003D32ECEF
MTVKLTRCIEIVPKRHAFKARFYNSVELINLVDFGSVRGNFSYSLFLHSKSFVAQGALNLSYAKYPAMAITIIINITFFINYFPNLILQAVLTQPEKDSPFFLACRLICSSKSSSKRICFIVLFERSKSFFSFLSCIGSYHYISNYLIKAIPRSAGTLSRDLTQPLNEVMIMANRYDNAHLCARQSKLYKFYDLSTAQVVQTTATTESQARKSLGKSSLIFIARIRLYPVIEDIRSFGGI